MAMRLEKSYPLLKRISSRLKKSQNPITVFDLLKSVSDCLLILFYTSDHALFYQKLGGTLSFAMAVHLDNLNNLTWLSNTVLEMAICTLDLKLAPVCNDLSSTSPGKTRKGYLLTFLLYALDYPIILFFMSIEGFGPLLAGICGTIASLFVLLRM